MTAQEYSEASAKYLHAVESALDSLFETEGKSIFPKLKEAMRYSIQSGGKRLRPCLLLSVCEMLGGDMEKALPFACAIEMIHTYSLIHDDLPCMDDDDMRRGRPSNHKVYGEAMATLAGDGLLSFAFETMLKAAIRSGERGMMFAADAIAAGAGASGMVTGQAADIEFEGSENQTEEMLEYVHRHKTADMLKAAVMAGAHIANADEAILEKLSRYSDKMGLLFQITDDILDSTGDSAQMGKTLGKDAQKGKLTFVSLLGIEGARAAAQRTAAEAIECLNGLEGADYLAATIEKMLIRRN